MAEVFRESLITVVCQKPVKFLVRLEVLTPSSSDLTQEIPRVYFFDSMGLPHAEDKQRIVVRISDELIYWNFQNNEHGLHDAAISFGLKSIRDNHDENIFTLTNQEYKQMSKLPNKEGQELREEILRFVYEINCLWPQESISPIDLQDNMIGSDKNARNWLNRLVSEELLELTRGFKHHSRSRGKPDIKAYRIAAKSMKAVKEELEPVVKTDDYPKNEFYSLIKLEVEQEGPFVFVIMPFKNSEFPQEMYESIIKPSIERILQCNCVRNDEDLWPGQLDDKFFSHIRKCQFLVAELSTENSNVVYELGLAHAFNKEVIMLVDRNHKDTKLSFDYDKFDTVFYKTKKELRSSLEDRVRSLGRKLEIKLR